MHTEIDVHAYVQDLEKHLQLSLFGGGTADPEGAVLLVRGALAEGDQRKAADLAESTQRLATTTPGNRDMAAAADHARGLVEQNPATLERAAVSYSAALTRARALEDAGNAWAEQGDQDNAVALLRQAHTLYERLAAADGMARVRHSMRAAGTRLCHWSHADRPTFGWDSLTDTERRIADLVAQGLSNRQVASRVFLSPHTVAFHLRHVFWKLDISSRVHLARMAAEKATPATSVHMARLPLRIPRRHRHSPRGQDRGAPADVARRRGQARLDREPQYHPACRGRGLAGGGHHRHRRPDQGQRGVRVLPRRGARSPQRGLRPVGRGCGRAEVEAEARSAVGQ
jgi:DNA-binding CsgD family transcriptional regulator